MQRTVDLFIPNSKHVESLILTIQSIMLRRDSDFPLYTIGKILWQKIKLRVNFEA